MFWKKSSVKDLLPPPVKAEHGEYSMILSAKDRPAVVTAELLKVSLGAIERAAVVDLSWAKERGEQAQGFVNVWPGEHYRLLAGLVMALEPKLVIEVGTSTGLSALCMKRYLPPDGRIATFDVVDWRSYGKTMLKEEDFDGQLVQHVADLSDRSGMGRYGDLVREADLIFVDAVHDGAMEERFLRNYFGLGVKKRAYLAFDDIRVWSMLKMWRELDLPKVDLTSFGHWSGTGLVEWGSSTQRKSVIISS